ncbi:MAG TPA: gamma-glutamyl-gamma-aminobutyrate hydrolase family protein [Phycisphaerae bacterium]|jgi:putative glutamine amidotransferase|nr:gamma-glutamyl-gamma-aminobutyrate hydrolase family protein [Phycisphaerae bacterium]HOB73406.1 gamma-glutamyl-gamma-aminobutyrate hydrolase family protein [Phycisphaerae bacterium]HOJ54942.1 gamma-glutamyl-gamma-aminobutyrate hydrolase family protein [Phycisphaerae bacterium]HOL25048.1 gamma-glutamyl-gamma-aminobutyrate hydrolase family protein [Phycisphaerae bacterium]HPP21349.1 gamma-glutamyl-gamma-aminobutyrate hydrolase family protein [Phycisphaerae bacterium]
MRRRIHAPLIGISCETISKRKDYADYDLVCDHRYAMAIDNAGGHPVLLPVAHKKRVLKRFLEGIDGLLIVGGDDVDPRLYGETPRSYTHVIYSKRTAFETWLYQAGKRRRLPIFGICYGMQLINVLEGGTLYQHLHPKKKGIRISHRGKRKVRHDVHVMPGTRLAEILDARTVSVISDHHQAIRYIAPGFIPSAVADDGIIEAIENPLRPEILAVQWHPERLPYSRVTRRLFKTFVEACAAYRRAHGNSGK